MRKIIAGLFLLVFAFEIAAFAENSQTNVPPVQSRKRFQSAANFMSRTVGGILSLTYLTLKKLDVA